MWEVDFADYICYYTVNEWGDLPADGVKEGKLRLVHCKSRNRGWGTRVTPVGFYVSSAPMDGNLPLNRAGSCEDDDPPAKRRL